MSKTEILMVKDKGALRPYGDADSDLFDRVGARKPVLVTVHQARNPTHHSKLFAIATKVADFDDDFTDAEDAIEWAKIHIPNMRQFRQMLDGTVVVSTKSISFASMDQVAFSRFFDRAMWLWSQKIGTDPETLLEQAEAA